MTWDAHDSTLLATAAAAMVALVVLIAVGKVHPFVALIVASLGLGLASGMPAENAATSFQRGFGETLGGVGIVLGLGAMLGRLMAESGGADRIVTAILDRASPAAVPWAMSGAALLVGIPMFFEIGIVLLLPMIAAASRRTGGSLLRVGIPVLASLSVLHGLLPPHPAPLLCANVLHADLGTTMALGLAVALPTVAVAGPLFGTWIARRIDVRPTIPAAQSTTASTETAQRGDEPLATSGAPAATQPGLAFSSAMALLPVALMVLRTVVTVAGAKGPAGQVLSFLGHPVSAMLLSVIAAGVGFSRVCGWTAARVSTLLGESLAPMGVIVMILGAGGGFKQTLIDSGVGAAIAKAAQGSAMSPILLGWLVAVTIRVATGSATVATVSASGILAPILPSLQHVSPSLLALSIGSGSLFFSHVNDAGFWLVKECFGMSLGETFRSWSVMETIVSVVGLMLVMFMSWV